MYKEKTINIQEVSRESVTYREQTNTVCPGSDYYVKSYTVQH